VASAREASEIDLDPKFVVDGQRNRRLHDVVGVQRWLECASCIAAARTAAAANLLRQRTRLEPERQRTRFTK